jgi:hypothetical protein
VLQNALSVLQNALCVRRWDGSFMLLAAPAKRMGMSTANEPCARRRGEHAIQPRSTIAG